MNSYDDNSFNWAKVNYTKLMDIKKMDLSFHDIVALLHIHLEEHKNDLVPYVNEHTNIVSTAVSKYKDESKFNQHAVEMLLNAFNTCLKDFKDRKRIGDDTYRIALLWKPLMVFMNGQTESKYGMYFKDIYIYFCEMLDRNEQNIVESDWVKICLEPNSGFGSSGGKIYKWFRGMLDNYRIYKDNSNNLK